jgi:predicted transcriptional regulator
MTTISRIWSDYSGNLRRRCEFDIISDILIEAREGALKTRIMYKCNLSFRQLETYLNFLLKKGLLNSHSRKVTKAQYFKTTPKGQKFLTAYSRLKDIMS